MISEKLISIATKIIFVIIPIYFISMIFYPFWKGGFDWKYVHSVWYTWQALNVGVLAFLSSFIAFSINRYSIEKQRMRDFIAERALLPHAVSELCSYLEQSFQSIFEGYNRCCRGMAERKIPLTSEKVNIPETAILSFQSCIRVAEPDVAEYLAKILNELQVCNSRIENMYLSFNGKSPLVNTSDNFLAYMIDVAVLRAKLDKIFDYARGERKFESSKITSKNLQTSFREMGLNLEQMKELQVKVVNRYGSIKNT
ncbi:hypothetical protein [Endozoicomonas acroporae]|uniref:hypothetical protein n=1 Tax=Endozoicomonas acroporae TaxID=1701104 RepID=UPI003D79B1AE